MNLHKLRLLCVASAAVLLAACSSAQAPAAQASASAASAPSAISDVIDHALDRANAKLHTENITISDHDGPNAEPKAEITPAGDLLIAGKAVPLTPAQRTEVLAYRKQLVKVAEAGMAIGKQGAALGVHATSVALAAVFSGESEQQVRQQVEAQASGIRAAATKICDQLPAMMASQQKLATDVPAFRPYATMTQHDIDDCHRNSLPNVETSRAETQQSVRDHIRAGIRSGVQVAAQKTGLARRGTPDASHAASSATAATSERP